MLSGEIALKNNYCYYYLMNVIPSCFAFCLFIDLLLFSVIIYFSLSMRFLNAYYVAGTSLFKEV